MDEFGGKRVKMTTVIIFLLLVGGVWFFWSQNRGGQLGVEEASELLSKGAIMLDVRSEGEFRSGHLSMAKNLPLNQLKSGIAAMAPSQDAVILCHCASGIRSGKAEKVLRDLGYSKVWNIGSYQRAAQIVGE